MPLPDAAYMSGYVKEICNGMRLAFQRGRTERDRVNQQESSNQMKWINEILFAVRRFLCSTRGLLRSFH